MHTEKQKFGYRKSKAVKTLCGAVLGTLLIGGAGVTTLNGAINNDFGDLVTVSQNQNKKIANHLIKDIKVSTLKENSDYSIQTIRVNLNDDMPINNGDILTIPVGGLYDFGPKSGYDYSPGVENSDILFKGEKVASVGLYEDKEKNQNRALSFEGKYHDMFELSNAVHNHLQFYNLEVEMNGKLGETNRNRYVEFQFKIPKVRKAMFGFDYTKNVTIPPIELKGQVLTIGDNSNTGPVKAIPYTLILKTFKATEDFLGDKSPTRGLTEIGRIVPYINSKDLVNSDDFHLEISVDTAFTINPKKYFAEDTKINKGTKIHYVLSDTFELKFKERGNKSRSPEPLSLDLRTHVDKGAKLFKEQEVYKPSKNPSVINLFDKFKVVSLKDRELVLEATEDIPIPKENPEPRVRINLLDYVDFDTTELMKSNSTLQHIRESLNFETGKSKKLSTKLMIVLDNPPKADFETDASLDAGISLSAMPKNNIVGKAYGDATRGNVQVRFVDESGKPLINHNGREETYPILNNALWFTPYKIEPEKIPAPKGYKFVRTANPKDMSGIALDKNLTVDLVYKKVDVVETKTREIPFKTIEEKDPNLLEGKTEEKVKGVNGVEEVTLTNGNETSKKTIKEPVNRVVRVGTKKVEVKTREIPFKTIYKADNTLNGGQEVVEKEGVNGTEEYTLTNGKETSKRTLKEPVNKEVGIGTKTKKENIVTKFTTEYQDDPTMLTTAKPVLVQKGVDGTETVTTTYIVDPISGKVSPKVERTNKTEPIKEIWKRGTGTTTPIPVNETIYTNIPGDARPGKPGEKGPDGTIITPATPNVVFVDTTPTVTTEKVPYSTIRRENENMLPEDKEKVVQKGVEGERKKTVTYDLDVKTGKKTPKEPTYETIKEKVDEIVEFGTGKTVKEDLPKVYSNNPDDPGEPRVTHPDGTVINEGRPGNVHVNDEAEVTTEKIPFETVRRNNDKILEGEEKVVVQGQEGERKKTVTFTIDPKTGEKKPNEPTYETIKEPTSQVVEVGTGKTTPIPKGEFKVIEDPNLPEGAEVIDEPGKDGVLHPDGKTVLEEPVQPIKRVGKPVTSKGDELPPTVEIEDLIVTQFVDENGKRIKVIEEKVENPDQFLKDEKGNNTHELDTSKEKTEDGGVVTYFYKTIQSNKGTELPPVNELPELKVITIRDENGKEIKTFTEEEFNNGGKEELEKDYELVSGPEDKGNGISEYTYQKKVNTPKDKVEVKDPNNLTNEEKELIKKKVEEVNPGKIVEVGDDGLVKLYDKGDKSDKVQTLKISDLVNKKETPKETKRTELPKLETLEQSTPTPVQQPVPVRQSAPVQQPARVAPETNSASVAGMALMSAATSAGIGFAAIRKRRQSK